MKQEFEALIHECAWHLYTKQDADRVRAMARELIPEQQERTPEAGAQGKLCRCGPEECGLHPNSPGYWRYCNMRGNSVLETCQRPTNERCNNSDPMQCCGGGYDGPCGCQYCHPAPPQPAEPDVVKKMWDAYNNMPINPDISSFQDSYNHMTAAYQAIAAHFEAEKQKAIDTLHDQMSKWAESEKQKALAEQEERLLREPDSDEYNCLCKSLAAKIGYVVVAMTTFLDRRRTKEKVDPAVDAVRKLMVATPAGHAPPSADQIVAAVDAARAETRGKEGK